MHISLEAWPPSHLYNTIHPVHYAKPVPSVLPYSPRHQHHSIYQHYCHVTLAPVSHCRLHPSTSLYCPQRWSWSPNVAHRLLLLHETNVTQRHHASWFLIAACTPQYRPAVLNVGPQSPKATLRPHLLLLNETKATQRHPASLSMLPVPPQLSCSPMGHLYTHITTLPLANLLHLHTPIHQTYLAAYLLRPYS